MRQAMDTSDSWLKRSIPIRKDVQDASDPEDLQYYIERRHLEFHPTFGKTTNKLVIDVDPGENVSMADTKKVVQYLQRLLTNQPYINDVEIQFSGNRGFYLWGIMTNTINIDTARGKLKTMLQPISQMSGVKVSLTARKSKNSVRLDLTPMKNLGSVKAEGSLDYRTGLISKKVLSSQLASFNPLEDASINTQTLKPAYSYKDSELI
jgi:DNA primase catalytic subunit